MRNFAVLILSFVVTYLARSCFLPAPRVEASLPSYFLRENAGYHQELIRWLQAGRGSPPRTGNAHPGPAADKVLERLLVAGQSGPGLTPEALVDTLRAVEDYPDDPRGWLVLAWFLDQEGHTEWAKRVHMVAHAQESVAAGPLEGVPFWMSVLRMHRRMHRLETDFWKRVGKDASPELVSFSIVHGLGDLDFERADRLLAETWKRMPSPLPASYRYEFLLARGHYMEASQVVKLALERDPTDVLKNQASFVFHVLMTHGQLATAQALAKVNDPGIERRQMLKFIETGQVEGTAMTLRRLSIFDDLVTGRVGEARRKIDLLRLNLPESEKDATYELALEVAGALQEAEPLDMFFTGREGWDYWDRAAGAFVRTPNAMIRLCAQHQPDGRPDLIRALWYSRRDFHAQALAGLSQCLAAGLQAGTPRGIPAEIVARAYWRADQASKDRTRQLLRSNLREYLGPVSQELEYLDKLDAGDAASAARTAQALFEANADVRWALFCLWHARGLADPAAAQEWAQRIRVACRYTGRGAWYIRALTDQ